jgi:hypothetical protein
MNKNVRNKFIHNVPKLKRALRSFIKKITKNLFIHTTEYYLAIKITKHRIHIWMNLQIIMPSERKKK